MASGKKTIIAVLLIATVIEAFFIINNPTFTPKFFLGVPYNPFVIYLYLTLIVAAGIGLFYK